MAYSSMVGILLESAVVGSSSQLKGINTIAKKAHEQVMNRHSEQSEQSENRFGTREVEKHALLLPCQPT